ncbi:Protein npg1 [Turnera subulata]|uniref:Protein npg1 n=1 Tax=Turnera subulata TaxID=218843 RepID=A0A9Q0FNV4_9ROSI|nr:Protein npg1 [Turnera subulata]
MASEDGSASQEVENEGDNGGVRELHANGNTMKTAEVEAKLDEGNIQEAESSLREGLSLNYEDCLSGVDRSLEMGVVKICKIANGHANGQIVCDDCTMEARALLGRLEYQRGNLEAALRVFDGIDLQAAILRLQPPSSESTSSKKGRPRSDSVTSASQHAASLVLEAIYLKAKSLQKLGKLKDAAEECKSVLDAVEKIFQQGIPDVQVDSRLQVTVSQAVELLPELWKKAGCYSEAITAYRRALLSQWNLSNECCARIQKEFAVFLLHGGVEAGPPSLAAQVDGSYVPKNNLEEAVLLLMILIRKFNLGKIKWDPSVMEHLKFALSLCGQTSVLSKQLEEIMPGVFHRIDRWNTLALCCSGMGQNKAALNVLRKSLHKHERPDNILALLLAAKICSEDSYLAEEGVGYAQRAINNATGNDEHLKGVGMRLLGLCLGKQATVSSSDFERSRLQSEALKSLDGAIACEQNNPDLIFELGVLHAEQRNLNAALRYAKRFIDATGGSILKGWRLLALVLSAQQRFSEAEVVIDAALDETAKWEQGPLLRLKAKLKTFQSRPMDSIETYRYLLALVQAQKKTFGSVRSVSKAEDDRVGEYDVCEHIMPLKCVMHQGQGQVQEAICDYVNALLLDATLVPCKILIGSVLSRVDKNALPIARSILSDALRIEPTNRKAWYYLGIIHRHDGRMVDAADCFQAASMLEESDPIESFSSLL